MWIFLINNSGEFIISGMSIFDNIILELALIFAGASILATVFLYLKQPIILAYIFLGMLAGWGYIVTFGFAFGENIFIVGSVVPGETIQVAAGFVSSSGALNPFLVWAVAFIGSFVVCLVLFLVGVDLVLTALPKAIVPFLKGLSLGSHFSSIERGVIDSRDIIYYLSMIGFFLFLNVRSVESSRGQ